MRNLAWLVLPSIFAFVFAFPAAARADDKSVDAQYHALADSRTNADLLLRKARDYFEKTENDWRAISQATDMARTHVGDQLQKEIQAEQRKPDETRDNDKINSLNDRSHQIDLDWTKFGNTDRPAIEQRYREAQQLIVSLSQIYNDLANLENGWKDSKLDLGSLQASFDAISKRAAEALDAAQKAVDDLKENQKTWEAMPEISAAPAPATPAKP